MAETREEEKERLMREMYNKKRTNPADSSDKIELTTDPVYTKKSYSDTATDFLNSTAKTTSDLLRRADESFDSLRSILTKQQSDLSQMSKDNGFNQSDMERMQKEIEKDYGLSEAQASAPAKAKTVIDSAEVFAKTEEDMKNAIVGNDEAIHAFCSAFRRPYVMGSEQGKAKNVILVTGPKGSGKHLFVSQMAASLKKYEAIESEEVYTIDMSRYSSSAQEQIFLQDLYKVLSGAGSIVCFENFEVGFPAFLRMVGNLVTDGKTVLSKRYVLSKGILVENQTGLVKNTVDSLSADGKYLVFITTKGTSSVQDAFGADFLYHVLDVVTLNKFNEENALEYTNIKVNELETKCLNNLRLVVNHDDAFVQWVISHYDKNSGADGINNLFSDFYISLSQEVLSANLSAGVGAELTVKEDAPVAVINEKDVVLSRSRTSKDEIDAINAEIDGIVGLESIKTYIRSLQSHIALNEIRRQQGLKVAEVSKHMIFTGNPGTGKTTIARLISRYMKAIGALSQGQLVEVTRADLVAQYVGQTAPLTMSVIKSALGGVLFIDEAYSLYRGKDDSFGLECIDTIVKAMEDNRDNLIVILAGYKKEMAGFLESNSGLKSRFPNIIDFPDYTGEELTQIAQLQAKGKGYFISEDALGPLEDYFNEVQSINPMEAGNGRLARNTVEDAILKQSSRVMSNPGEKIDELKKEDFDYTVKVKAPESDAEDIAALASLMNTLK